MDAITEMMIKIARASEQLSHVVVNIKRSILFLNEVAEDAAGGTGQSANRSNETSTLTNDLKSIVDIFKI